MKFILVTITMSLCACASPLPEPFWAQGTLPSEVAPHTRYLYDPVQCTSLEHQCQGGNYRNWGESNKQNEGDFPVMPSGVAGCSCQN